MKNILLELNDEQKEAVVTTEGFIRVIAGAGSGKTKALTYRYAYLVNEMGISTSNILCVTFTNKAANEMKKRIRNMIGDNDTGYISTFHGFCVRLLKEDIHTINYPQEFIVMDTEDTEAILKEVYQAANIQSRTYTFDMARHYIRMAKDENAHIPYLLELDNKKLKEDYEKATTVGQKIFLGYLYEQKKCFGLDFDDLITLALYILENFEEKRKKWQERMMYVMVDEFQDVSKKQYRLANILSDYHKNLYIVGDPDQTIYSWRGAHVEFILDFDKLHKDTKTIILDKNYRSTPNILKVSNSLIRHNKKRIDKELMPIKNNDIPVIYNHLKTTQLEAEWIADEIEKLVQVGSKYSDIAILYRAHYVSRNIEESFIRRKIPYTLYSGIEFYKRKEIKDVISYLRMIVYADDLSFLRVVNEPKRNIGKKRIAFLKEYAEANNCSLYDALKTNIDNKLISSTKAESFINAIEKYNKIFKEMKLSEVVAGILDSSGYKELLRQSGEQERLDNLAELEQSIYEFEKTSGELNTLEEYLQNIALFSNLDKDEKRDAIKMMTVHSAKGLEFPYVFVCDLNEGVFPSKRADTVDKMEEERRLAYVAYTRAEKVLFLSDAEGMNYDGSFRFPSRFIFNIEKVYLDYVVELDNDLVEEAKNFIIVDEQKKNMDIKQFQVGDEIYHKTLGRGKIIDIKTEMSVYVIKFDDIKTERNLNFATDLEKIGGENGGTGSYEKEYVEVELAETQIHRRSGETVSTVEIHNNLNTNIESNTEGESKRQEEDIDLNPKELQGKKKPVEIVDENEAKRSANIQKERVIESNSIYKEQNNQSVEQLEKDKKQEIFNETKEKEMQRNKKDRRFGLFNLLFGRFMK